MKRIREVETSGELALSFPGTRVTAPFAASTYVPLQEPTVLRLPTFTVACDDDFVRPLHLELNTLSGETTAVYKWGTSRYSSLASFASESGADLGILEALFSELALELTPEEP
jgi:hypothetical protein